MGGTFDPIHKAHLAVAEEARRMLDLNEVIFIPAGQPWFKAQSYISAAEYRIDMVRLAIARRSYFTISLIEVERQGPSYAVDTVAQIKSKRGPGDELFFVLGWDSLLSLHLWQEASRLISLCRIVAAPRPGCESVEISALDKELPGLSQKLIVMEKPLMDISATEIRERVKKGRSISRLVPKAVENYIREKGLYKTANH
jgi:nicotinate-nucleotide adenylyltransferase